MNIAKATPADIEGVINLSSLLDHLLDTRNGLVTPSLYHYSQSDFNDPDNDLPEWASCIVFDADGTYDTLATIKRAYSLYARGGLNRVAWGIGPLIDAACDPDLNYLALRPEFRQPPQSTPDRPTLVSFSILRDIPAVCFHWSDNYMSIYHPS